ncbi:MAG TPA: MBL fold metallo-hydrolase [Planctomycetes bacterium]|nr:MBL fold metallo-hydrolase [Planctomycetota bacterium]HIL37570.1 MBL fold metallo-hydrolase [Planctomycetota bacterium]
MQLTVLASGSGGNSSLLRIGEGGILVDAGLGPRLMRDRWAHLNLGHRALEHVLVTHGHLDHSRSAGALARRQNATLHCAPSMTTHRALARAPRYAELRAGSEQVLECREGTVRVRSALLPHDCDPTLGFRLECAGRRVVILTDLGKPDAAVARHLADPHVLLLEFNYDEDMLREGPYPDVLKRRVAGDRGHLSNLQAQKQLALLAGPSLHTLVLGHISQKNNTPDLAIKAAESELARLNRSDVRVLVAQQDQALDGIQV